MIGIEAQVTLATQEQAKKITRRMKLCIQGLCGECDLNKRFDDGQCLNDTMEDARILIEDAYLRGDENHEEGNHE